MSRFLIHSVILSVCIFLTGCADRLNSKSNGQVVSGENNREKRAKFLEHLLSTYRSDKDGKPQEVPVWENWLRKSGELPPDFDQLQANAFPPELLRFQNGDPRCRSRSMAG
ncbi:MAG: hypothetical protein AB2L24_25490 [Mangrovibacterium sp.]